MATIDTIETISDALSETSIGVLPKRCSYIRNWNSKCQMCLNACKHEAIKRSIGHLEVDSELCTDCGACTSACPTNAFVPSAPSPDELVREARESAQQNAGTAIFICTPHAEQLNIDTTRVVVLPCLNYLDEYLVAGMLTTEIKHVVLMACGCKECSIDSDAPYFKVAMDSVRALLKLWGVKRAILVTEEVPPELCLKKGARARAIGSDRREAFKQTGGSVMDYLITSAAETIGTFTGDTKPKKNTPKRIIVRPEEVDPPETYRSIRMLKMLDRLGTRPYGATIESRYWASVDIDPAKCRYCGACATMCVTRALKYTKSDDNLATLTFQPSLCINCGLCKDSCINHTMVYSNTVLADNLDEDVVVDLYRDHELPKRRGLMNHT